MFGVRDEKKQETNVQSFMKVLHSTFLGLDGAHVAHERILDEVKNHMTTVNALVGELSRTSAAHARHREIFADAGN